MTNSREDFELSSAPLELDLQTFEHLLFESKEFVAYIDLNYESLEKTYDQLLAFYGSELGGFDCFDIGGWRPTENQLSDVIAALLAPAKAHGLGLEILKCLLQQLLHHCELSPVQRDRVCNLANAIRLAGEGIIVKRERIGSTSRADIELWGPNFLLIIEHKVAKGKETFGREKYQTTRLVNDFRTKAAYFGIEPTHTLFIFLAPEGMRPHNEEFIPLSFEIMSRVLRSVAEQQNNRVGRSVLGFSEFYRRLG